MDSLVHHWNETKSCLMNVIFILDYSLSNDHSVIKVQPETSHRSAVKAQWWCDLWEDLCAAAL